jgi:hypothetical protein
MRAGQAQATVRALPGVGLANQAFSRSCQTQGGSVCQSTGSILYDCWITVKDTRGKDIGYGWKGKGSTIHLLTAGNGLPLAFLVSAANMAEVTVGLKVVDQVRVPRPQGHPKKRPANLAADKS